MITAQEARVLAGPFKESVMIEAESQILKAANSKLTKVALRGQPWDDDKTDLHKECVQELEANGFRVKYFFECNQFVDAGVMVDWRPEND